MSSLPLWSATGSTFSLSATAIPPVQWSCAQKHSSDQRGAPFTFLALSGAPLGATKSNDRDVVVGVAPLHRRPDPRGRRLSGAREGFLEPIDPIVDGLAAALDQ